MKHLTIYALLLFALAACSTPQIEGHYTYEHAFDYDMEGSHFDVHETGTMDFRPDGTALDSARQVYKVTLAGGDTLTWVFNYISPSTWRLEGEDLCFAGVKETFRMELLEGSREVGLAQRIVDAYSGGIDREQRFHIDTLTASRLQWSFTYADGHSDTWEFFREKKLSQLMRK